jgi:hypothetical protein
MIILRLLRLVLPPFHPIKYWWITYWFGEQSKNGVWTDTKINKKTK